MDITNYPKMPSVHHSAYSPSHQDSMRCHVSAMRQSSLTTWGVSKRLRRQRHYITAESQVPTLRVGSVISLYSSFLKRVGNLSEESLGNFIIIEITHEVSQGSYYKNRFKAIPATIKALPSPKVRMPLAET